MTTKNDFQINGYKIFFAAALFRTIPVSSIRLFYMKKLYIESFIAYLQGPLTGPYSKPDEPISYHKNKFITV